MINKVDRLVLEVGASPAEAYERMRGIVAHVNMILSAFRSEQLISDADALLATEDARAAQPRCLNLNLNLSARADHMSSKG